MFKKNKRSLTILVIAILVSCLIFYSPYIFTGRSLQWGTDIKTQWFQFYTEFRKLLTEFFKTKQFPFYSWNLFLGNNFYSSKAYYLIGDVYCYISLLLPLKFYEANMIMSAIKFMVAGISFYLYLSEFEFKEKTKIIVSYVYAFTAWSIFFSGQLVFLSFYSLMPLWFKGFERILKKERSNLFVVSTAVLLACNFYFFYTISIFLAIYAIYRYNILKFNFKKSFDITIKLLIVYFLGICLVSFIWLPAFFYIKQTDRILLFESIFFYKHINVYLGFIHSLFAPNFLYIYRTNVFESFEHSTREVCLWIGSTLSLILLQLRQQEFKKYIDLKIYFIFLLIMLFPILSSAVHGFGDPQQRWLIFVNFFNLLNVCYVFDNINIINTKILRQNLILAIFLMFSSFGLAIFFNQFNFEYYYPQLILLIASSIFYFLSYFLIKKQKDNILLALILSEILIFGFTNYLISVDYSYGGTNQFVEDVTSVLEREKNSLTHHLDYLNKNQQEFYRVYLPVDRVYWDYSHNMSVFYNLKGLVTYDSTYSYSINTLKKMYPEINEYSDWIFNIKNKKIMDFLATKFFILPKNEKVEKNLVLVDEDYLGAFNIYENTDYQMFATSYSEILSLDQYLIKPEIELILSKVICFKKDCAEIKNYLGNSKTTLTNVYYGHNQLHGEYNATKNGFMVMALPYDEGWTVKINNSEVVKTFEVNGGFIGFPIISGKNTVDMYFMPRGFKEGLLLSAATFFIVMIINLKK